MNKKFLWIFVLLLLVITATATKNYDEFNNDETVDLKEIVVDATGVPCLGCAVNLNLTYPNGSLFSSGNMTLLNVTTGTFNYTVGVFPLVENKTTIYLISIVASDGSFNGTSDRTIITIYDVFPPVDSGWDLAIVLAFGIMSFFFAFLAMRMAEENTPLKLGYLLITLFILLLELNTIRGIAEVSSMSGDQLTAIITSIDTVYRTFIYVIYFTIAYFMIIFLRNALGLGIMFAGKNKGGDNGEV